MSELGIQILKDRVREIVWLSFCDLSPIDITAKLLPLHVQWYDLELAIRELEADGVVVVDRTMRHSPDWRIHPLYTLVAP